MHRSSDPVADKFPHHTESVRLNTTLNRARNIRHPITAYRLRNSFIQGFLGHINQFLRLQTTAADRNRPSGVTDKALMHYPDIETNNIAKLHPPQAGQPVNHLLIHRDADITRILSIAQKRTARTVMPDSRSSVFIYLFRCRTGCDPRSHIIQHRPRHRTSRPHQDQLTLVLDDDHKRVRRCTQASFGAATGEG